MPSYADLKRSMAGLWLLIKGDARGLSAFDISDRGVLQSFWAFVCCLPAMLVIHVSSYRNHVALHAGDADSPEAFAAKMVVVEVAQWLVPTVTIGAVAIALGLRPLARTLIITRNWFALPLVYATSVISALDAALPAPTEETVSTGFYTSVLLSILLLIVAVVMNWRLLRTIVGGPAWPRLTLLALTIIVEVAFVWFLEARMGVSAL